MDQGQLDICNRERKQSRPAATKETNKLEWTGRLGERLEREDGSCNAKTTNVVYDQQIDTVEKKCRKVNQDAWMEKRT